MLPVAVVVGLIIRAVEFVLGISLTRAEVGVMAGAKPWLFVVPITAEMPLAAPEEGVVEVLLALLGVSVSSAMIG